MLVTKVGSYNLTVVLRGLLKQRYTRLGQRYLIVSLKNKNMKLTMRYLQTNASVSGSSSQNGFLASNYEFGIRKQETNTDSHKNVEHLNNLNTPEIKSPSTDIGSQNSSSNNTEEPSYEQLVEDYVGHPVYFFDTLDVYKELVNAKFSHEQSVTIIELIQQNLNTSFDNFNQKFTPKIDLENENYLFEAASSELRVEMKRSREEQLDELRNRINILEREYNYVFDELNDSMIKCKNECEVALNDHKSDSTLLQKQLNIQIRELENRINSQLISELKFSVESLRWSLTRRGIFSILLVAASVLLAVTSSKIVSNSTPQPQASKPPFNDEFVKDNDEFPKDNDEYVQYEEWHQPKVLK